MKQRVLPAVFLLLGAGCGGESPPQPPPVHRPVVREHLARLAGQGLPETSPAELRQVRELLEATLVPGRLGVRARRALEEREAGALAAALLALAEDRDPALPVRRPAYSWLRSRPYPAALPRLILRLKYEKDWVANATLAAALLEMGNGAGLDALVAILETQEGGPGIRAARTAAAEALRALPPTAGWEPGADFARDWDHLLETRRLWLRERRLDGAQVAPAPLTDGLRAEIWRMIARFDSQPLRPVDDARYALTRLDGRVVPELAEALDDESRYVREHALQTLGWMGAAAGWWQRRSGFPLTAVLEQALRDPLQRTRALEALGACGLTEHGPLLLPWLRAGSPEEATAAADALLRCADERVLPELRAAAAGASLLAPEARYSLALLEAELDRGASPAAVPEDLDPAEKERRDRWRSQRSDRPPPAPSAGAEGGTGDGQRR